MKQLDFEIKDNNKIADNIFKMRLMGDISGITPGQFVNILLPGFYLRRPISVCDASENELTIIYKSAGRGTELLSTIKSGSLNLLTCLGNGYDTSVSGSTPLLIGGGVGVPPLYMLAKKLISEEKKVTVILGFNTKAEVFYENEFKALGAKTFVTTVDGSHGIKGFVTDKMTDLSYSYFYTCGPEAMLKAVYKASETSGQFSFEERMGCGFGACMGCSCKTVTGYKRICKDGPVLKKEEIIWEY